MTNSITVVICYSLSQFVSLKMGRIRGYHRPGEDPYYEDYSQEASVEASALGAGDPQEESSWRWDGQPQSAFLVEIEKEIAHGGYCLGTKDNGSLYLRPEDGYRVSGRYQVVHKQGDRVIADVRLEVQDPDDFGLLLETLARCPYGLYYANRSVLILCLSPQRMVHFQPCSLRRQYRCQAILRTGARVGEPCYCLCAPLPGRCGKHPLPSDLPYSFAQLPPTADLDNGR